MSEQPIVDSPQPEAAPQQQEQSSPQGAPWEREGEQFDPQRAWNLVQALRSERDQLRQEREAATARVQEFEQRDLTEQQRIQQRAEQAEREREDARTEALRLRMAVRHGLREEDFDLLGTGDEATLAARAQRIAALYQQQTPPPNPAQRPVEQLRPGATPNEPVSAEDAVYAALYGPSK